MSSTLAANISINTGGNVEFGQGIAGAAACDSSLTITPGSVFSNTGGSSGVFYFGNVKVSDASTNSTTGLALCTGKYIRLAAYDSSTSTPLTLSSASGVGTSTFEVLIGATNAQGLGVVTLALPSASGALNLSTTSASFTLNFATAAQTATAGNIYKITVESHS